MIRQLEDRDWDEVAWPYWICELPLSVNQIERKLDIAFDKYIEDGLGVCFACLVSMEGIKLFLRGYGTKDGGKDGVSPGVTVAVRSFEPYAKKALKNICATLNVAEAELPSVQDELSLPRWQVMGLKSDGETEVCLSFHEKSSADFYCKKRAETDVSSKFIVVEYGGA